MIWKTPPGFSNKNYNKLLDCNHLLIAGCSGSGKSVVLRGIIRELLQSYAPCQKQIILLDPKRVDFIEFKNSKEPHILKYANNYKSMVESLNYALNLMESRYKEMERKKIKMYDGTDIYVIIDEYADLHDVGGKDIETKVIRLCQLARAARIHVIIATQRTISCVSTRIRANMDNKLALRTINAKESQNIIEQKGAENLPIHGYGLYQNPLGINRLKLNMVNEDEIDKLIYWWTSFLCQG